MQGMSRITPAVAFTVAFAAALDPALSAPFGSGGADAPFLEGGGTLLNWAFVAGVLVALGSFLMACAFLYMRNLMGFAGGVLGVVIGGTLMAQAPDVVSGLTGLENIF